MLTILRLRCPCTPCSLRHGGSLVRPDGPVGLGRPDSQAYQGAADTQSSKFNSDRDISRMEP